MRHREARCRPTQFNKLFILQSNRTGGLARNRTGVQGFAVLCVTTPPRGLGAAGILRDLNMLRPEQRQAGPTPLRTLCVAVPRMVAGPRLLPLRHTADGPAGAASPNDANQRFR